MKALCEPNAAKGLLFWPKEVLQYVDRIKFAGCSTSVLWSRVVCVLLCQNWLTRVSIHVLYCISHRLQDKQLHMVGYLFELFYDLMIAPRHNVSQSPGFETPLGVFGGGN